MKRIKNNWITHFLYKNLRNDLAKNIFSFFALFIAICFALLITGFQFDSDKSIESSCDKQFAYGSATIYKEIKTQTITSGLSIVKTTKLSNEELSSLEEKDLFNITPNFDVLISNIAIKVNGKALDNISFLPVYSFTDKSIDTSLVKEQVSIYDNSLDYCFINKKFADILKQNKVKKNTAINISSRFVYSMFEDDDISPSTTDTFILDKDMYVAGVIEEFDLFSMPTIYYSYSAFESFLKNYNLSHLSLYHNRPISWFELIDTANENNYISSYSHRLFLKDVSDLKSLKNVARKYQKELIIQSNSYSIYDSVLKLKDAVNIGAIFFLMIIVLGTALIIGVLSLSNYLENRKKIAILSSIGAKNKDILKIFVLENVCVCLISLATSFILIYPLQFLLNYVLELVFGMHLMIDIPFLKMFGIYFLLPVVVIAGVILLSFLSSSTPLVMSKHISIKEELKNND